MFCVSRATVQIEERLSVAREALRLQSAFDDDLHQMTSHVQQCNAQLQQLARGIGVDETAAAEKLDACQQLQQDLAQRQSQMESLRQSSEKLQLRGLTSSSEEFSRLSCDVSELSDHVKQHERTLHDALQLRKDFVENKNDVSEQLQQLREQLSEVEKSCDSAEVKRERCEVSVVCPSPCVGLHRRVVAGDDVSTDRLRRAPRQHQESESSDRGRELVERTAQPATGSRRTAEHMRAPAP